MATAAGLVWAEGRPETVRIFRSWLQREWLAFIIGLRTWWPDPRDARRVTQFWPVADIPELEKNALLIAQHLDKVKAA